MWISTGEEDTNQIKGSLQRSFGKYGLEITFREINTNMVNKQVEFLDVNHVLDPSANCGFFTAGYAKPTAKGRQFINGFSHHPPAVFKSIIFSEAIRMRRVNERDDFYLDSLQHLQEKCIASNFPIHMTVDMINRAKTWKDRFQPPRSTCKQKKRITWSTSFPQLLQLSTKEAELQPNAALTYKKPDTPGSLLKNYKHIALKSDINESAIGSSLPCGKCSMSGNHGKTQNMVASTTSVATLSGMRNLKQKLTCKNYGVYAATCTICSAQYVGQTIKRFSTRWSGHRSVWNGRHPRWTEMMKKRTKKLS